jgi:polysaccharide biosynthesis transport protein
MKNPLNQYIVLAKRWIWMIVLGVVICSGATFTVSKIIHPVYQASATIILNSGSYGLGFSNFSAAVQAIPTYAQLLISPAVLNPVVAQHRGLTYQRLSAMITVKPQTNTLLIELDVENRDPRLAAQLANEISQSFAQFSNSQLPGTIEILPAQVPTDPIRPKVLLNTGIGALVGLGLALALIVIFEWIDDRLAGSEEVQELLGMETLAIIPLLSRKRRNRPVEETPDLAEGCRILCASLIAAQATNPFQLVMVTSALAGEGKSTIASNLAFFMARSGKRVLLVDADLRRPVLDQYFELNNHKGLSNAFLEMSAQIKVNLDGQPTEIQSLRVLTAGLLPPNPAELLQSPSAKQLFDQLKKAQQFDYVILDTPPLLPTADTQILASYVQAIVLVVDPSKTPRKLLFRVKHLLDKMRTPVLGVVINKSRWPEHGEIRQYLKDARHHRTTIPAMTRRPETPSVNSLGDQDITVVPPPMTRRPETPSVNSLEDQDITVVLPPRTRRPETPSVNSLEDQDTVILPRLQTTEEEQP